MLRFFNEIYHPTYALQGHWKTAMHLVEEMGEATTELSRVELTQLLDGFSPSHKMWKAIKDAVAVKVGDSRASARELASTVRAFQGSGGWNAVAAIVGEKFKEEIADVLSWLSAVIYQLLGKASVEPETLTARFEASVTTKRRKLGYLTMVSGKVVLQCPYCSREHCSDGCLVENAVSSELYEAVAHY